MLIIVRHGRTAANASGLLLGRGSDPELDELGRRQASAIAAALPGVERIVTSPLSRARETASAFGRPVEVDERWTELDYGELEGVPLSEVPTVVWDAWRNDPGLAPGGGESLHALGERVRTACADLAGAAADGDVVVVSHVSPVKAALAWALGVGDGIAWRAYVAPGSITRIATGGQLPSLHAFNGCVHLEGLEEM